MAEYQQLEQLQAWVQKTLPAIFDDSLSYYELLSKILYTLNQSIAVIQDLTTNKEDIDDLTNNRKLDAHGNFTGSWWNIDKPVHIEGGIDGVVDLHDKLLSRIIKPSGLQDDTDRYNIQNAIDQGKKVLLTEGIYYLSSHIIMSNDKPTSIIGAGRDKTILLVTPPSNSSVWDSVIFKNNSATFGGELSDFSIDGNLFTNHGLHITSGKQIKVDRIYVKNTLGSFYCFGGDATKPFYEANINDIMGEYEGTYPPLNRPDYGIELLTGTHDSYYKNIVIKNVKISGLIDAEPCNNFYNNVHVYGYPEPYYNSQYGIITKGQTTLTNNYFDSCSVAGIKISGKKVNVNNSIFFWLTSQPNANCFEIDDSTIADYITINGNMTINLSSGVIFKFNGNKPSNFWVIDESLRQFGGMLDLVQSQFQPPRLRMSSHAGSDAYVDVQTDGKDRWRYGKTNEAETGSNTGSNFGLLRYDDNGNYIDTPISVDRSTGQTTFNKQLNVPGTYTQPLKIKNTFIWCNSAGLLWCKIGSLPTSEVDGQLIPRIMSVPSSSSTPGQYGDIAFDSNYLYIWTGSTVNKRIALTAW